ncbi:DUF5941 domain-containing protein [Streptomyces sp. ZYX-F-203]
MPTAILTGPPVPDSSVEAQLRSLGFEVVRAADGSEVAARLTEAPEGERVAVVDTRFVGHLHALRLALTDPRFPLAAVSGAVTARPAGRRDLARAVASPTASGSGLPDALADALADGGAEVHRPELGSLVAAVADEPRARDEARRSVAAVDEEAVRLRASVKSRDGFFTTFCVSPYSRHVARWCARRGLTPNQVTTASLVTAVVAAGCAASGTRGGYVAAGLLLLLSFVLDCADGQLARYALRYSTLGAWLDATFDRAKEYVFYAGLALGAARSGDDVWALALAAMALQTCRHAVDFAFTEAGRDAKAGAGAGAAAALSGRLDDIGWTVWARRMIVLPIGERWALIAVLTALTTPRVTFWVLLALSALAALYTTAGRVLRSTKRGPRRSERAAGVLADLTDSGPVAEALAGRLRGSRGLGRIAGGTAVALVGAVPLLVVAAVAGHGSPLPAVLAACYAVTSAVVIARPLTGPLDWLVPPVFRAAEYGTVLALAAHAKVNGALPAAFGLVAAVAYHHYDTVYRLRGGSGAPPGWLVRAIGGQEGRVLAVAVLAASLTGAQFTLALTALAVAVASLVLVESIRFWVSAHQDGAPAVHDEGEPA